MPRGVKFGPVPTWVTPFDASNVSVPESSTGTALLVLDSQTRAVRGGEAEFTRSLVRITSELGAKTVGEQKFVFVPPYQTLVLHTLEVRRAGQAVSALRPGAVQVLQREAKLESGVYDGAKTAVVVLSDVRVGDEIASEFSVVGSNPVAAGHFATTVRLLGLMGVGRIRGRIISDRELSFRVFAGAPGPEVDDGGPFREYLWHVENSPAFRAEEGTPPEADTVPWAMLTDFRNWGEVVSWGRPLFEAPKELPKPLKEWRRELLELEAPADRVLGALRMVQERVRYLSLAFAESSHRPANPELVLERGFGDCKDKSLLAVTLLRSLGVDADVALVSSTNGELLPRLLPAVSVFDHVLVTVEVDGVRYWLDPTRLYQRGTLADVSARNFRFALRLADGVSDLVEIEEPDEHRPNVSVLMRYVIQRFGGPTQLEIATTYVGANAELVRSLKASGSAKSLSDQVAAPVLKIYPRALAGEARVEDLEAANEVVVHQTFELDADDWALTKEDRKALGIFPPWLGGQLPTIPADRKYPVVTAYPLRISHHVEVRSPIRVSIESSEKRVPSPVFDFSFKTQTSGNELVLDYGFDWRARRIRPEDFVAYRRAVADATRLLDFSIIEPLEVKPAFRATLLLSIAVWSLVLLGMLWYVELRQPYFRLRSVPYRPELAGRRGWLALLGFGVTINPVRMLIAWAPAVAAYGQPNWTALTSPASPAYSEAWEPILTLNLLLNLTQFFIACYSLRLYWSGRRSFPLVYSLLLGLAIVSLSADLVLPALFERVKPASEVAAVLTSFKAIVGIPVSVLWIAYLSRSARVKATFLRRAGKHRALSERPV